jgi:streptomycin 6-kinase
MTTTAGASLWQVHCAKRGRAVLKYYGSRGMGNEANGFRFLSDAPEAYAARVYMLRQDAALIEWLDGPSLGDVARAGQDFEAAQSLLAVACGLHQGSAAKASGYPRIGDWFAPLLKSEMAQGFAPDMVAAIAASQRLVRHLLQTQTDLRPLHGDLHHDNVLKAQRGFCAFDAKGILGERAFELANAFRHPRGCGSLVGTRRRILALADLWSAGFGVERQRLLQWAAVKCALSIVWRSKGRVLHDEEQGLLARLLACAQEGRRAGAL